MSNHPVVKFLTAVLIFAAWAWVFLMIPVLALAWYYWPRYEEPDVVVATPDSTSTTEQPPDPVAPAPQTSGPPPGMRRSEGYVVAEDTIDSSTASPSPGGPDDPLAGIPIPPFPDPADVVPWSPKPGTFLYQMAWPGDVTMPGGVGTIWLWLPPGELTEASLPCVLIGPGGSNLLSGKALDDDDMAEHVPYVQAGFAVVAFSIDGDPKYSTSPYAKFRDSYAGMVNARNALEFTLAMVPEVDPERIFVAGHSSAGTLALLYAEHEPRLKGCVAYMPVYDVYGALKNNRAALATADPDATQFLARTSPRSFADRLACPAFLFSSEKDGNVPVATVRRAGNDLRSRGKDVTIEVAPSGDHYRAMIESGIPAGIAWMKGRM